MDGIAREADAGGRCIAHIAEHHGLHVGGGADLIGNLFHAPVSDRVLAPPGAEHGVARHGQLLARVLRKRLAGLLLHQLLVVVDDGLQIFGGQVGIELGLHLLLALVEDVIELVHVDVERHFAEHLDEAAIAVVGEARIAALLGQALDGLVVQAEVEDGVHHAGHGELGAGAHADAAADRRRRPASCPSSASSLASACAISSSISFGTLILVLEIDVADFGGDGEAGRHGHARAAHLGQAGAFAAENVFHLSVAVGGAAAKCVNVFFHDCLSVTISEKSAIVGKLGQQTVEQRQTVPPDVRVGRVDQHLVEEEIDFGAQRADAWFRAAWPVCAADRRRRGPFRARLRAAAAFERAPSLNCACFRIFLMRLKLAARGSKSGVARTPWTRLSASFEIEQIGPAGGHAGADFVVGEAADVAEVVFDAVAQEFAASPAAGDS